MDYPGDVHVTQGSSTQASNVPMAVAPDENVHWISSGQIATPHLGVHVYRLIV